MLPLLFLVTASAHVPEVFITNADEDWCAVIESVAGGDYVMLEPGDYTGPCEIVSKVSDPPGEVTIVQSLDPGQPARMVHDGSSPFILSLAGDVGLLLNLDFGEVPEGVVAVELRRGNNLGVRSGIFAGPGTAVKQVADIGIVGLRDCLYEGATGVALDVGCGGDCAADFVEISNNLVDGGASRFVVQAGELELVDNTALGVEGTPFLLDVRSGVVAGNTLGADVPLDVTGDVLVHSNVLLGEVAAHEASVVGNTVVGGIAGRPGEVAHNAVVGDAGPADVSCDASCFVDLEGLDFYPDAAGPLVGGDGPAVETDWCDRDRAGAATVGAHAYVGEGGSPGPVEVDFKSSVDCRLPAEPEPLDTGGEDSGTGGPSGPDGDGSDSGQTGDTRDDEAGGCGCGTGYTGLHGWVVLLAVGGAFSRRRPVR